MIPPAGPRSCVNTPRSLTRQLAHPRRGLAVEATHAHPAPAISAQGLTECTEDACHGELVGRGLCRKHYVRWHRRTPKGQRPPARNLKRLTPAERFAAKVDKRGPDECWLFTGSTADHRQGHGEFFVSPERGKVPAHTFALELATGVACPPGMEGCHRCDNPPCCNPAHIYYGTRQQNVDDMHQRGRARVGSARPNARLSENDVVRMRERFASGEQLKILAVEYGIGNGHVSRIVNGLRWKHAGGPITTRGHRGHPSEWRTV